MPVLSVNVLPAHLLRGTNKIISKSLIFSTTIYVRKDTNLCLCLFFCFTLTLSPSTKIISKILVLSIDNLWLKRTDESSFFFFCAKPSVSTHPLLSYRPSRRRVECIYKIKIRSTAFALLTPLGILANARGVRRYAPRLRTRPRRYAERLLVFSFSYGATPPPR